MTSAHDDLLARFRWLDGHADVAGLFADGDLLAQLGPALAEPFAAAGVTKVAAVEARGFVLGTAAALALGVGFVPIRKAGSVHPGPKATTTTEPDWRGARHALAVQRRALARDDRVLLVDDWAEVGAQALGARRLVESCGAGYGGLSLLVDQLADESRRLLEPVASILRHAELPPS